MTGLILFLTFCLIPNPALAINSQILPLAEKSLLLDGQVIGDRIIVVGERGHILLSEDHGVSWQQQEVPTRANLTSVFFIDPANGWAAGHDGRARHGGGFVRGARHRTIGAGAIWPRRSRQRCHKGGARGR